MPAEEFKGEADAVIQQVKPLWVTLALWGAWRKILTVQAQP